MRYVGDSFIKVGRGSVGAVVFLHEMAEHYVRHPSEVFREGQAIDFVLLERGNRNPDEWVGSIVAVSEARTRQALSGVEVGTLLNGTIVDIEDSRVELDCNGVRARAPISELAWGWFEHPSEVVRLGEQFQVEVLRVDQPSGWLSDKRARRAHVVVSIRACLARPESPIVEMPFSCQPFKVWVVARKPRCCDPVVLHVLEEIVRGRTEEEIRAATGLPERTLDAV
ncbi:MAG: S1 RNA-binding domain-containing protein, partial [Proteobacteria bacterium]|nr:S1 RNA-binding domain-containing protein [Pseudomonadota bacterium]